MLLVAKFGEKLSRQVFLDFFSNRTNGLNEFIDPYSFTIHFFIDLSLKTEKIFHYDIKPTKIIVDQREKKRF